LPRGALQLGSTLCPSPTGGVAGRSSRRSKALGDPQHPSIIRGYSSQVFGFIPAKQFYLLLGVILHKLDLVQSIVYSGGSLIILVYLYSCELIWPQGIHDAMYAGEYTIRGHFFGELLQKMFVFKIIKTPT